MKKRYIFSAAVTGFSLIILIIGRLSVDFATWYGTSVYPVISLPFSWGFGLLPFSFGEILIGLFILACLAWIFLFVFFTIRKKGSRKQVVFRFLSWAALFVSLIFLLLTLNCSIHYNRKPFSQYSGLEITPYSKSELKEATLYVIDRVNFYSEKIETDEKGACVAPENIAEISVGAMNELAKAYPVLAVHYPQPKPMIMSELMSYCNLCGVYFPFTVEANYNANMPDSSVGFTVCHELSHLSGFMREDEANYISYLACRSSGNDYLNYCGYLGILVYMLNAYSPVATDEEYAEVYYMMSEQVIKELAHRREYWKPYQKTVISQVSSAVNDTYLKVQDQTDGEKSYGRVVDLVIAEYLANQKS